MTRIKLILFLAMSLLASSCIYTNEIAVYPKDWSPVLEKAKQGCKNIEGQYLNKPIKWTLHPTRVASDFAFPLNELFGIYSSDGVLSFKLTTSDSGIFKIEFINRDDAVIKELSYKNEDFICTPTGLSLSKSYYSKGGESPRGPKTNIAHFNRTADGNLAIHVEEHFKGMIYFFPAITHESQWVLFKAINKSHK